MSKNCTAKRDKKKKIAQKKRSKFHSKTNSPIINTPNSLAMQLGQYTDGNVLTIPEKIDDTILQFCSEISSFPPVFLDVEPEPWCRQSSCDRNVLKYIEQNGGEMLCGYKIWYSKSKYIEGERHAVWARGDIIKDLTFNAGGEFKILFVKDKKALQTRLELNRRTIRWSNDIKVRQMIVAYEALMASVPQYYMSNEESWNETITYEQWCSGT